MSKIKGIYAASMSLFNRDMSLNIEKTVDHAEKIIDQGCHGVVIFGSTGQAQLISVGEKIGLLNNLSNSRHKDKFIIGTGLNSLNETVNLIKYGMEYEFKDWLVMPAAYYKGNTEEGVYNFYKFIISEVPKVRIILYNFERNFHLLSTFLIERRYQNKMQHTYLM